MRIQNYLSTLLIQLSHRFGVLFYCRSLRVKRPQGSKTAMLIDFDLGACYCHEHRIILSIVQIRTIFC